MKKLNMIGLLICGNSLSWLLEYKCDTTKWLFNMNNGKTRSILFDRSSNSRVNNLKNGLACTWWKSSYFSSKLDRVSYIVSISKSASNWGLDSFYKVFLCWSYVLSQIYLYNVSILQRIPLSCVGWSS